MHWNTDELVEAIASGLCAAAREADLEQAASSLDAHDELGLHPLIHASLEEAGFGVWPEVRYPGSRDDPRRNRGQRCDLVLTPDRRPLAAEAETGRDLFQVAEPRGAASPVPFSDAYWMEIKTAMQFSAGGPHRGYAQRLLQAASGDILKMSDDPLMAHAGLLIVVFTQDEAVARHDLAAWHLQCLEKDYPLGFPSVEGFALNDRLGNGYVSVALFPVR